MPLGKLFQQVFVGSAVPARCEGREMAVDPRQLHLQRPRGLRGVRQQGFLKWIIRLRRLNVDRLHEVAIDQIGVHFRALGQLRICFTVLRFLVNQRPHAL